MTSLDPEAIRFDEHGLVPVIAQDRADGRVLMLGYANREALDATIATGEVHFHSRSRGRLWRKGETSGNVLRVVALAADCDADAVLATVVPAGPTCHTGARSCFDDQAPDGAASADAGERQGFDWLETLWQTIGERARMRPPGSYTVSLVDAGLDAVARKVAEEATEVVLAAKDHAAASDAQSRAALAAESADLLYHLLVLLAERGLAPSEVIAELRRRAAR